MVWHFAKIKEILWKSLILEHCSLNPNHDKCPKSPYLWCNHNWGIATAKSTYTPIIRSIIPNYCYCHKTTFWQTWRWKTPFKLRNRRDTEFPWKLSQSGVASGSKVAASVSSQNKGIETATLLTNQGYKTTFLMCAVTL